MLDLTRPMWRMKMIKYVILCLLLVGCKSKLEECTDSVIARDNTIKIKGLGLTRYPQFVMYFESEIYRCIYE